MAAALAADVAVALVTAGPAGAAAPATPAGPSSVGAVAALKARAVATLKILKPNASVKRKGKTAFKPAHDGQKLRVGDTIQTDATGLVEVDYTQDSYTRLDVNTTFTIKSLTNDQGKRQVEGSLDTGRTWNRTSALTQSESFSQDAAGATASVIGSAFYVECQTATLCRFIPIVDGLKLVGGGGDVKTLLPHELCVSTDGVLCSNPTLLTNDELAAIAWIQQNLLLDELHGFGPGPIQGTLVVNNGQVTSFTPGPPPPNNNENPPAAGPPTIDPNNPVFVDMCGHVYPDGACATVFGNETTATPDTPSPGIYSSSGDTVPFTINASAGPSGLPFNIVFDAVPDSESFGFFTYNVDTQVVTATPYASNTVFTFNPTNVPSEGSVTDHSTMVHVENADAASPSTEIPITVDSGCGSCC
jgi:hypothetical protein